MITPDTLLASIAGTRLSLGGLLRRLHTQGRLAPLVCEALAAQLVREQAQQEGLSVSDQEMQSAADGCRRLLGLHTAAETLAWLNRQGLSVDDFESALEEPLLAAKLAQHLTAGRVEAYFSAHQSELERLKLLQLLVERDDLARELASQVREEGRDLQSVAREHGEAVTHHQLFRKQLTGPLAEALDAAKTGELIGPIPLPLGFALIVIEECQPAELSPAIQQSIQNELFTKWLADRMKEATFDLAMLETAG